jgi:hypothetical protein
MSVQVARLTYWLAFILAPTGIVVYALGMTPMAVFGGVGSFVLLVGIGEHGIRRWLALWNVADTQSAGEDG